MSQPQPSATLLIDVYAGWDRYQSLLVQAVAPRTDEELSLRVAPTARSAGELAMHIIASRVRWFHEVLGAGDALIAPLAAWDDTGQPERNAAALEEGLDRTWTMIERALKTWTTADLADQFEARDETVTRQRVIWHVLEHDLSHGGELFLTLGAAGLRVPNL